MLTLCLGRLLHLFRDLKGFPGVYYVDNSAGSCRFQVLQENPSVAPVGVRRVDAFCGEVIELFEVRIPYPPRLISGRGAGKQFYASHDDLLLVRIFEWLRPLDGIFSLGAYEGTAAESRYITSHDW